MDHHHSHDGHGGGDITQPMQPNMCSMNMLFTWDTTNLCIIFHGWRITGFGSLLGSLLAIIALTAGYEALREASRRYEARQASVLESVQLERDEHSSRLVLGPQARREEQKGKAVRALFYGVQVFYSFFVMLLFMTYNGWVMISVAVGAFIGYLLFSGSPATKSAACH